MSVDSTQRDRRILAIDGGGIKGAFAASLLTEIEEGTQQPLASQFDLIVGTSTGGILALGLGLGFSASDIRSFYQTLGPKVFAARPLARWSSGWLKPKYDSTPLQDALTETFGERQLGESNVRLVIPSLSLETGQVYLYKTAHHERLERDFRETAVRVAMATSSAPTYFPTHRSSPGVPLVDGGVWANNPTGLAVVEAIGILEWPRESIRVFSVSCLADTFDAGRARLRPKGRVFWATRVADLFMAAQSSSSTSTAEVLVGKDRVYRIEPRVPRGRFELDSVAELESLVGLGAEEGRKALPRFRSEFLLGPAEPFVPCYSLGEGVDRQVAPAKMP